MEDFHKEIRLSLIRHLIEYRRTCDPEMQNSVWFTAEVVGTLSDATLDGTPEATVAEIATAFHLCELDGDDEASILSELKVLSGNRAPTAAFESRAAQLCYSIDQEVAGRPRMAHSIAQLLDKRAAQYLTKHMPIDAL